MNNILKGAGILLIIFLIVFLGVKTSQIKNTATTTNTMSFNGEGKVLARPDIAVINISIVTEAETSKAAQDDNSKKSNNVVGFLEDQDIDEKDIKTSSYNISPIYEYPRFGERKITGYRVNQSFEVKIRDLDNVGLTYLF